MRTWMNVVVVAATIALAAGCKKKCPDCPATPPPTSDAGAGEDPSYKFVYAKDEKTGNQAMIAVTPDNKTIVVPLDPAKTRVFIDGKESTLGETVQFGRPGGCPCQIPSCWPYCRPAGDVLGKEPTDFYGTSTTPVPGDGSGSVLAPQ